MTDYLKHFRANFPKLISPGQRDSQVDTGQCKLQNQNLCMDLQWVAKQIHKSAYKSQKAGSRLMHIHITCNQLMSTCIGWPNGETFALICILL